MTCPPVISYGGGVQSTALLVLAARGEIPHRTVLFCNVGEDSENPDTLAFVRDHARPYAERHGLAFVELVTRLRDGSVDTITQRLIRQERTVHIPMRMANGAPGNRSCTYDFKIKQVAKWTKAHGATEEVKAHVALGISIDEYTRMRTSTVRHQESDYPLIDRRLSRQDCMNLIAGTNELPTPPKSSCFYCPFQTAHQWRRLKRDKPDLFARAAELERIANAKRAAMGKDEVWMSSELRPLEEAFADTGQLEMFEEKSDGTCDIAGYCMV